jgi:polyisoprenoid-binding protein YceI
MKLTLITIALSALVLSGCGASDSGSTSGDSVSSGTYAIDPSHTYVTFSYLHQGLSYPLLRATSIDGELDYDSNDMANSNVNISVATDSIRTNIDHFDKELASRKFFNAEKYPYITFATESYSAISDSEGILTGNVTIRDITRPLELAVTLNNALVHPMLNIPAIGFSATGSLSRSDFGLDRFVPVVSDTVVFNIETEFLYGSNDGSGAAAARARAVSAEK